MYVYQHSLSHASEHNNLCNSVCRFISHIFYAFEHTTGTYRCVWTSVHTYTFSHIFVVVVQCTMYDTPKHKQSGQSNKQQTLGCLGVFVLLFFVLLFHVWIIFSSSLYLLSLSLFNVFKSNMRINNGLRGSRELYLSHFIYKLHVDFFLLPFVQLCLQLQLVWNILSWVESSS